MTNSRFGFRVEEDMVSGDFIFDAFGVTLDELFKACALASFSAMTEVENVSPRIENRLVIEGEDCDALLYNFLAELIYLKDAERSFYSYFDISIAADAKSLTAVIRGEPIDHERHVIKTDVKAVTYHGLKILKQDDKFVVRIILDL